MFTHRRSICPPRTFVTLARCLAAHRSKIGPRWRRITPSRQALLVLAHLRCGDTYAQLAAAFGIGIATVYRYVSEAIQVLAALAPSLAEAIRTARRLVFVILDGTHGIVDALAEAGLKCWADKAYQGAGGSIRVPFRGRRLKRWQRRHDSTHAKIRCLGEQAMATLKGWRFLRKLRCSTNRITDLVKAVLALHHASA